MNHYAFISYSHKDLRQVRKFHKALESYRVPGAIRKLTKNAPKRIFPIFRDETDLSGVTLTPRIEEALESSDFLIVICTRSSAKSVWVQREITAFLQNHSPKHIIPVFLDYETEREFRNGFPGSLSALEDSRKNSVIYCKRRKKALFEIASQLMNCYSPMLTNTYLDSRWNRQVYLWAAYFLFAAVLVTDLIGIYEDHFDITRYCTDISFSYDEPQPIDPLNPITRLFAEDYYICTYRSNKIVRIQHVSPDFPGEALPGAFLLESEIMEFSYTSGWDSCRVSRVIFRDENGQVLFVKNFALDASLADLTVSPESSDPWFLPADIASDSPPGSYSCRISQLYDDAGRIRKIWFASDTFSYLTCDSNGYYGISFDYDDSGEVEAVHFLDLHGNVLKSSRE